MSEFSAKTVSTPDVAPDRPMLGISFYLLAALVLVSMDAVAKYLAEIYPPEQVIWCRYLTHLAIIMAIFPHRVPSLLKTSRLGLQIVRSVTVFGATTTAFFALKYLQLAEISAFSFLAPLIVIGLSVVLLKEKVGPRRWFAVVIGFGAVLFIIRPTGENFGLLYLLPLGMAFFYALFQVLTRMLKGAAPQINTVFYGALVGAILATIPALLVWETPELVHWPIFALLGVLGGGGQYLMQKAFENAEASLLTPFGYSEIIWSVSLGLVIFGDWPAWQTFVGAGVIMASGLYVFYREQQQLRKPRQVD